MDYKYSDKWREWLTIRTRNRDNMVSNIFSNTADVRSVISRMIIDDVTEVAPVHKYTFPDSSYHTVRLLLTTPTSITKSMFASVTIYCIGYARFPYSVTTMAQYAMRGLGASQTVNIILPNPVPPTGSNTSTGMTVAKIYVPDGSLAAYKSQFSNLSSKIYAMSSYTQRYY